ncbi:sensor domain-containing protein [Streptomyces sp. DG1A-41]|uniref:sensor domain-containing protein n=1 Tax=Streptomyces sp. DG1A-41 TaxID=3125779 RepID=UPI0030CAAB6F
MTGTALAGLQVAAVERFRLGLVDAEPAPHSHRTPGEPGLRAWLSTRLRERSTWRELGHALLFAGALWLIDVLAFAVFLLGPSSVLTMPLLWPRSGRRRCSRRG